MLRYATYAVNFSPLINTSVCSCIRSLLGIKGCYLAPHDVKSINRLMKIYFNISEYLDFSKVSTILFITILCVGLSINDVRAEMNALFLYHLSDFSGPIPYNWANIYADSERNEIYVIDSNHSDITVYNDKGMEIYRFNDDSKFRKVYDLAVKKDGSILIVALTGDKVSTLVCDFRGEIIAELEFKGLPPEFSGFAPNRIAYRNGLVYGFNTFSGRVVVAEENGIFRSGYDLYSLAEVEEKKRADTEISGWTVDYEGNVLFTIPVLFRAFRLSPDGELAIFGRPGGSPGGFNIVAGIAADVRGFYYVTDRLKSAVIIFDRNLSFVKEFGYRGPRPENLIGPNDVEIDGEGRLYVSQLRNRGISVFKISYD